MSAKSFRELIGVPPSTANMADSTLIIIDAQNEYAEGALKTANVDSTRAAIADLLARYRSSGNGDGVVHVTQSTPDGAPVFTPGTRLAAEFDELAPHAGEKVVQKQQASAFGGTDLHDHLRQLGDRGKKIVLTGYMAHVCVSTTARAGADMGYDVILAEDAIGDRDVPGSTADEVKRVALTELADAFGTVVKAADIK